MNHAHRACRAIAALAAIAFPLLASARSIAADCVTLKPNVTAGTTYTFVREESAATSTTYPNDTCGKSGTYEEKESTRVAGRVEVLGAIDGRIAIARISFDKDCSSTNSNPWYAPRSSSIAGQTFTVAYNHTKDELSFDGAPAQAYTCNYDPTAQWQLRAIVLADTGIYPKQPVAVGDSWEADQSEINRRFNLYGRGPIINCTLKLTGIRTEDGRRVAELEAVTKYIDYKPGSLDERTARCTALMDIETGLVVKYDSKGEIKSHADRDSRNEYGDYIGRAHTSEGKTASSGAIRFVEPKPVWTGHWCGTNR